MCRENSLICIRRGQAVGKLILFISNVRLEVRVVVNNDNNVAWKKLSMAMHTNNVWDTQMNSAQRRVEWTRFFISLPTVLCCMPFYPGLLIKFSTLTKQAWFMVISPLFILIADYIGSIRLGLPEL